MQTLKKMDVEVSGMIFSLPYVIAKDEGLFEEEGLDVHLVWASGGRRADAERTVDITADPEAVAVIGGHNAFEDENVTFYRA